MSSVTEINFKKPFFVFLILSVVAAGLRAVEVIVAVDPETGFVSKSSLLPVALTVIVILCSLIALVYCLLKGFLLKKNNLSVDIPALTPFFRGSALTLAVLILADGVYLAYRTFTGGEVDKVKMITVVAAFVFSVISLFFFNLITTLFAKNSNLAVSISAAPALYFAARMFLFFLEHSAVEYRSSGVFTCLALASSAMFLINFAKLKADFNTAMKTPFYAAAALLFNLLSASDTIASYAINGSVSDFFWLFISLATAALSAAFIISAKIKSADLQ